MKLKIRQVGFCAFNTKDIKEVFAETLRKTPTPAEARMKKLLKRAKIPFEFQPVVYGFIPDFLVSDLLVVEVDGGYHKSPSQIKKDAHRSSILIGKGYRVTRFSNDEVFSNPKGVIAKVKKEVKETLRVRADAKPKSLLRKEGKEAKFIKSCGRGGLNHPVRMDIVVIPPKPSTPC